MEKMLAWMCREKVFSEKSKLLNLSGPQFLILNEIRSLCCIDISETYLYKPYYSTLTKGQSLYMALSKETCPGKVSLTKQDSLKPGSLIHFRIKKNCQYKYTPISKIICLRVWICVYKASISQVFMVFRTAHLGPQ